MRNKPLIIILILSLVFLSIPTTNFSYAGSDDEIYSLLQTDYPNFLDRMLDSGVTENEIKSFLSDLCTEIEKTSNLTESNFNSVVYNATKKVLFEDGNMGVVKPEHYNFAIKLLVEFNSEITQSLNSKKLTGDLAGLSNAAKSILLNESDETDAAGGTTETTDTTGSLSGGDLSLNIEDLKAVTQIGQNGEINISLSQESVLNSINDKLAAIIQNEGKTPDRVEATINLKMNGTTNSESIALPSLGKVFDAADVLSIETNLGTITFEKNSLTNQLKTEALNLKITKTNELYQIELLNNDKSINSFYIPLTISIPYTLKSGETAGNLTVVYVDPNGKEIPMGGIYASGYMKFYTNHLSAYTVKNITKTFSDISSLPWVKGKIESLAAKGIINGKSDQAFDPNAKITRAEFAAMVTRLMKFEGQAQNSSFSDVNKNAWYSKSVAAAFEFGMMKGKSSSQFDPNGTVTIEEVLVTLGRVMNDKGFEKVEYNKTIHLFSDDQISSWAKSEIGTGLSNNLNKDIPFTSFIPNKPATRAQVANMIYEFNEKIL